MAAWEFSKAARDEAALITRQMPPQAVIREAVVGRSGPLWDEVERVARQYICHGCDGPLSAFAVVRRACEFAVKHPEYPYAVSADVAANVAHEWIVADAREAGCL